MKSSLLSGLAGAIVMIAGAAHAHGPSRAPSGHAGESVAIDFSQPLPNVPGKSLVAVEVVYAPGASSPSHSHADSAFIYAHVVSGRIESKVDDGPARIYEAGESFHELPGSHHPVSRNASATEPAKLLAVFVVDSDETELTTADK
ncbi:MAG TPA: cupin domain-containing protein [Lysobacter sp.]